MNTLPTGLLLATALTAAFVLGSMPFAGAEAAPSSRVLFGMDAAAVSAQAAAGVPADYGTFWIGPWTLSSGWGGPDAQLTAMKNAGVAPAIHFYYWGDDISPNAVENGVWSTLHNAQKTRAGWETLGTQLTDHLNAKMGGQPVVIFLESEFNKGGIETYEPFDGYMAAMAAGIHARYPSAIVVLGFGNWGSVYWGNFDRAAAASDMVGIQGMRGSTRQSATDMMTLYDGLLAGVKTLEAKFPGKPLMLTDIAVSSYPEPGYLTVQRDVLKEVFDNLGVLKSHGVRAIIYRSWLDSPNMDTANYYGMAERYWGLANSAGLKPSAQVWVDGVKAERAGTTPSTGTSSTSTTAAPPSGAYTATVTPSLSSNEWWIQVGVSPTPAKVETKVADGAWTAMDVQSYGYTKSLHAPSGTLVQFRVTSASGQSATTSPQAWLVDMSAKTATSPAPTVSATVTPVGNEWWVQAGVATSKTVTKVEAKAGSAAWVSLGLQSYGWASSFYVPAGTMLQFRVTASDGSQATTAAQAWLVDMSAKTATFVAPATSTTTTTTTTTTSTTTTSTAPSTSSTSTSTSATSTSSPSTSTSATSTSSPTSTSTTSTSTPTSTTTTTTSTPTPAPLKATFSPKHRSNNAAVEAGVQADQPLAKVEAKVDGGAYVTLAKTNHGTYAAPLKAPDGAKVTFRATSLSGATATSVAYTWG